MHTVTPASASTASNAATELTRPVPDQVAELIGSLPLVHQQVADLLGRPRPVRVRRYSEDVHVAAGDLDHEEDIEPAQGYRAVHREEIARQQARRLGPQEPPPRRVIPAGRRRRYPQPGEGPPAARGSAPWTPTLREGRPPAPRRCATRRAPKATRPPLPPRSGATSVQVPGFVVLAAGEYGGELELLVETVPTEVHCGQCGVPAHVHDRREHLLRDVPVGGRATVLVWWKRIWRCPEPTCAVRTWTERSPLGAPRHSMTSRAKAWVTRRVGADGETVTSVARTLGVGWWSVMRAVIEVGRPLVEDPGRLEAVTGLGVDEHAWQRANAVRHTQYDTGVVGLDAGRPARLLEVVQGRSGGVYGDWLAERPDAWREQIRVAALDPFRGYLNALREHLPDAAHVLDACARPLRDATAPEDSVISVHTDDVERAYEEAQKLGYEIVKPITTEPWGVRRFFVRAPDGYVINIVNHRD